MSHDDTRQTIESALLDRLAEVPFAEIRLADVASAAGASLADLRRHYDGPLAILSGFARRIDVGVLAGTDASLAAEPVRDRLFDALMRRFDLLSPHRAGLRGLRRSARRDPVLALHLTRLVVGSQAWMLQSAGVATGGLVGRLRAPVLAAALVRLMPIFLAEEEEGLPKTMAALDETLKRLEKAEGRVARFRARFAGKCRRSAPNADDVTREEVVRAFE